MLWMHRHTATTKSGQEGRRLLHQYDYRIFDFHLSESSTQQCFFTFMILGNTRVPTVRLTILDRLVDIIDAPSNCIPAPNCTINRVNLLQSISYFPLLNVNATCSQSIYVSPEKEVNCKISLTIHSSSSSLISVTQ